MLSYDGHQVIAIFDNNPDIKDLSPIKKAPVYHGKEGFLQWKKSGILDNQEIYGMVAIGGSRGKDRQEIQRFFMQHGVKPHTAVHPRAFVAKDAILGVGCQIMANAAIASEVILGEDCIVNTSANIDHECVIGNGVHIAPGAKMGGLVTVGEYSLVGIGATVSARVVIGKNAVIHTGVVVTKNIPDNTEVHYS